MEGTVVLLLFRDSGSAALPSSARAFQGHPGQQRKPMVGEGESVKAHLLLTRNTSAHVPLMSTHHMAPTKRA